MWFRHVSKIYPSRIDPKYWYKNISENRVTRGFTTYFEFETHQTDRWRTGCTGSIHFFGLKSTTTYNTKTSYYYNYSTFNLQIFLNCTLIWNTFIIQPSALIRTRLKSKMVFSSSASVRIRKEFHFSRTFSLRFGRFVVQCHFWRFIKTNRANSIFAICIWNRWKM